MKSLLSMLALSLVVASPVWAQKADPLAGTWRLNVAKSNMQGPMASSSETVVFKVVGDEETFTANATAAANGETETTTYTAKYGGPDAPMTSTYTAKDGTKRVENATVAVIRISDRVRERQVKRNGEVVMRARRQVSEDGKTLTASIIGKDGKVGQTRVFDRQ